MTRRLRIPAVLAITVLGASACDDGGEPQPPPMDSRVCFEGYCVQDPSPDAGVCPAPDSCAVNFMCPEPCLVT